MAFIRVASFSGVVSPYAARISWNYGRPLDPSRLSLQAPASCEESVLVESARIRTLVRKCEREQVHYFTRLRRGLPAAAFGRTASSFPPVDKSNRQKKAPRFRQGARRSRLVKACYCCC